MGPGWVGCAARTYGDRAQGGRRRQRQPECAEEVRRVDPDGTLACHLLSCQNPAVTGYYSGPLWAYRTAMLFGAAIVLPAAGALVASAPSAPAAVIGFVLVCGGLGLLWLWWLLRDKRNGRARRFQILGACSTLATIALFETALVLFLGRAPGDPIGAFVPCIAWAAAAACCLAGRIAVGLTSRRLGRNSSER